MRYAVVKNHENNIMRHLVKNLDVGLGLPYNQSNIYTKLFVMFDTTFFQPQLRAT